MNPCIEWVPPVAALLISLALAVCAWRKKEFRGGLSFIAWLFAVLAAVETGAVSGTFFDRGVSLLLLVVAVGVFTALMWERETFRSGLEAVRCSKAWPLLSLGIGLRILPLFIFAAVKGLELPAYLVFAVWTVWVAVELFTRKKWPMLQQFSTARLKSFLEEEFGVRLRKLSRLPGNSHSLNFFARDFSGQPFAVKCIKGANDLTLRRIIAHAKSIRFPFAPTMLFGNRTAAFGDYTVFALKWIDGERKTLDRLSSGEILSLLRSYAEFLSAMSDDGEIQPERDLSSVRLRLLERLDTRAAPEIAQELAAMGQEDLVRDPARVRVIHGDLNFGNLHFRDGEVPGFIDIEELRFGYPAEDLVRYAISGAEHFKWHEFARFRKLNRAFAELVRNSGYSAHEWNLAINGYLLRKLQKKIRHSRPSLASRLNFRWRMRLYRSLRETVSANFHG